jgi:hypothetical protein
MKCEIHFIHCSYYISPNSSRYVFHPLGYMSTTYSIGYSGYTPLLGSNITYKTAISSSRLYLIHRGNYISSTTAFKAYILSTKTSSPREFGRGYNNKLKIISE